jgi:hypothetical protein
MLLRTNIKDDLHAALEYKGYVKPTHILCSIQLNCYTWFAHWRAHLAPPTPDMKSILMHILMQVYVLPHLPPALYQLAYPKKSPILPGSVGTTATLSSGSSNASTILSVTTPVFPPPTPTRSAVINLHPIASLQNMLPSSIKLKDLIGNTAPPKCDSGDEMCLSFLTRNTCWSNCRRASAHKSTLTPGELQRLSTYLATQKQHYDARRTAASTASQPTSGSHPTLVCNP